MWCQAPQTLLPKDDGCRQGRSNDTLSARGGTPRRAVPAGRAVATTVSSVAQPGERSWAGTCR